MGLSYSFTRNAGLVMLLFLVFLEGVFSFLILTRHSGRLTEIITRDEVELGRWYEISEIIAEAKDRMYDYRLGSNESLAAVDLLMARAVRQVTALQNLETEEPALDNMRELLDNARQYRELIANYIVRERQRGRDDEMLRELEHQAVKTANHMAVLGRSAVTGVSQRIREKHDSILTMSSISQRMLVYGLLLAAVMTVLVAFLMARTLARPVRELVSGTEKLAAGDLSCRVMVRSNDEIGRLAAAFNRMADQLQENRDELVTAKNYTDNIMKSMINSLVVVDSLGEITTVNEATCRLLDYHSDELVGQDVSLLFARGYYEKHDFAGMIAKGGGGQLETAFCDKHGRNIPMLASGAVLRDAEQNPRGFVCVAQDITLQAETLRAGHLASLGEMAAGVAHEINNPLNTIINFAQLLVDELKEEGAVSSGDILERIIGEADRVSGIVRSLLCFAREEDKIRERLSLSEVVAETLALTEMQIRKSGILLEVDVPGSLPAISGHFQQLQQVVLNVINNARYALDMKFEGTHPAKRMCIIGKTGMLENCLAVILDVVDYGSGISEEVKNKVKNPFFSTKPPGSGTGLGLTISHGIISGHGGKIDIDSQEGEFTRIRITLPAVSGIVSGGSRQDQKSLVSSST